MVGFDIAFSDERDRLAGLLRGGVDLVVDIREVGGVDDPPEAPLEETMEHVEAPLEETMEHVEDDRRSGIADMGEVVDGRPQTYIAT